MEPEEVIPAINYIPYNSEPEALAKVAEIDSKYQQPWIPRSTDTYATPLERIDGKFYLPIYGNYRKEFSEDELSRGVEVLPEALPSEEDPAV